MSAFNRSHERHRECWELLPWIANERLAASDSQRIASHLSGCASCQAELETQRRLREAIRAEEPVVLAPQASLQKLLQRLDEEPSVAAQDESHAAPKVQPRSAGSRRHWLGVAAAVQTMVIGLLLASLGWQWREQLLEPRFSTLTTPTTLAQGPVVRIVPRENLSIGELNELLHELQAHIVAGPSSAGVYTIQLARQDRSREHIEHVAEQLRKDPRIVFSEPAIAESDRP